MSGFRGGRQAGKADYDGTLRAAVVVTVIGGVVLLALIAFRISYGGIHSIVLTAGVSPAQAGAYPLILDGLLVMACVAGLALHGAEWWMRGYAWLLVLILLAAMAALDAMHAAGIGLPRRWAAVVMALVPWVLLLLGLALFLGVLRHLRAARVVSAIPRTDSQDGPVSADALQPVGWAAASWRGSRLGPTAQW